MRSPPARAVADYLLKDHKPSAMQGKARLRGRERSNYSTTISPMRNDKGFIPNETADRGLRACPNNEFGFGSCEILRVLMLVTPKRHYRDFHASFNALGTCCHSFIAAKPTQAGFPPTSRDVRCQAGRYAVLLFGKPAVLSVCPTHACTRRLCRAVPGSLQVQTVGLLS